jgi:hypothetical protein
MIKSDYKDEIENVIQAIATNPAPAEIPSTNGSAKLLQSMPCNKPPDMPHAAPTITTARIRGNRRSQTLVTGTVQLRRNIF